jgi:hypothetical protein
MCYGKQLRYIDWMLALTYIYISSISPDEYTGYGIKKGKIRCYTIDNIGLLYL